MSTIFALSSGLPPCGVAVMRLTGPRSFDVAAKLTSLPLPQNREVALRKFSDPKSSRVIDEGLLLLFGAPASFTGEDVAEFHVHGSRAVIEALSAVLMEEGLAPAEPGSFTRRAFRNQKLDLTEVEGLGDVLQAETAAQLALAQQQTQGTLAQQYQSWRSQILEIQALIEAELDFSDEELGPGVMATLAQRVDSLIVTLEQHSRDNAIAERVRGGIKVVIVGPPNAGKSTLLNTLAKRDVAIVSDEAGTTRDSLEVQLDLAGYAVTLIDTAGMRDAHNAIEREGIARARAHMASADVVVAVMAPGLSMEALDSPADLVVMNKSDLKQTEDDADFHMSLKTGEGVDAFLDALTHHVASVFDLTGVVASGNARHSSSVRQAIDALTQASQRLEPQQDDMLVVAAEDCRVAASALGRILGTVDVEDVLGAIFSSFCIGK